MVHYVGLLADKVQALGGNPWAVPATPDGGIPLPAVGTGGGTIGDDDVARAIATLRRRLLSLGCGLLLVLIVVLVLLMWLLFGR